MNDWQDVLARGIPVVGVDEVGRGPLAGPVVAAAVVLDNTKQISGITDSKKLSSKKREHLSAEIKATAIGWSLGRCEFDEIDDLNIFQATMVAMRRAVDGLCMDPQFILVDGKHCPQWQWPCLPVISGDTKVAAISAASILAKVDRDNEMLEMHERYPDYGFDRNKGYPTAEHLRALQRVGICPIHRRSFGPVKRIIEQNQLGRAAN